MEPTTTLPSSSSRGFVGGGNNFNTSKESRQEIRQDLRTNTFYDCESVLNGIINIPGSPQSDSALVTKILNKVKEDHDHDLQVLQTVSRQNIKTGTLSGNELEGLLGKYEVDMYPPLARIFRCIEKTCADEGRPRVFFRQLICCGTRTLTANDPVSPTSFNNLKPDFPLYDLPPPMAGSNTALTDIVDVEELKTAGIPIHWRRCAAFLEVKPTAKLSPRPARINSIRRSATVKETLIQGAEYARTILASRPLDLFVYGIFICGMSLTVARFDRRCVMLSTEVKDISADKGLPTLIRVVLAFIWNLSPVALGGDPTVTLHPTSRPFDKKAPFHRYVIRQHPESGSQEWITSGPPIWVSHSLFGRATSVWRVTNAHGEAAIMKVAWRSPGRMSEGDAYMRMQQAFEGKVPEGLATARTSFDVILQGGVPLTIHALRGANQSNDSRLGDDASLHRIVLADYGKPLWESRDTKQLAQALESARKGLDALHVKGILHRDISAGNILIKVKPVCIVTEKATANSPRVLDVESREVEPTQAFITDFEFASFPHQETKTVSKASPVYYISDSPDPESHPLVVEGQKKFVYQDAIEPIPEKKPGDIFTGTAIFMAEQVLRAWAGNQNRKIPRTKHHDRESFVWVIVWSISRYVKDRSPCLRKKEPQDEFVARTAVYNNALEERLKLFSAHDVQGLLDQRSGRYKENLVDEECFEETYHGVYYLLRYIKESLRDEALVILLKGSWAYLKASCDAPAPAPADIFDEDRVDKSRKAARTALKEAALEAAWVKFMDCLEGTVHLAEGGTRESYQALRAAREASRP